MVASQPQPSYSYYLLSLLVSQTRTVTFQLIISDISITNLA